MKKVILFLSIISAALLMTSCLGEVSNNYRETGIVYIAPGAMGLSSYGRTHTGRFIISSEVRLMDPGSVQIITYNWDEANGVAQVGENIYADQVNVEGEPVKIDINPLRYDSPPEEENPAKFIQVRNPFYVDDKDYFGDKWLFEYAYKAKKGEEAHVEFYLREEPDSSVDATIDIRLVITGEPEANATAKQEPGIVALNMSSVRSVPTANSEQIRINFYYHLDGQTEPQRIPTSTLTKPKS